VQRHWRGKQGRDAAGRRAEVLKEETKRRKQSKRILSLVKEEEEQVERHKQVLMRAKKVYWQC
jgi:hypothetical protein